MDNTTTQTGAAEDPEARLHRQVFECWQAKTSLVESMLAVLACIDVGDYEGARLRVKAELRANGVRSPFLGDH